MRASLLRTRAAVCLMVAAPIFAFAAPSAQAQATHGTFFFQNTGVGQEELGDCFPGFAGPSTDTSTTSGSFVQTESGYHVNGTFTIDGTAELTNGYHVIASARSHFTFNTTFSSGQTVSSQGGPETHTVYNTEGDVVARVKFVGFTHITYRDANGNLQPDDGEITASMDHLNVICLGTLP